jgi:NADPH:quinone reductase-like Zn-dependent oxidoreductase
MKAIVYREYGPPEVLRYEDVGKPVPADGEVLIEVRASSVNPLDWHFMRGTPRAMRFGLGLRAPGSQRLGVDVAGRVEAVGPKVTAFKPGDEVFGAGRGAFAEYACAKESDIAKKPESVSFEHAASANIAGVTALQSLRKYARVQAGQKILIVGASGGVGTFAVQIAKVLGAHVTGVCSTRNVELVRSIGADAVIDYTRDDFTNSGQRFDAILDCIGSHSISDCRRVLNREGRYVFIGAFENLVGRMFKLLLLRPFVREKLVITMSASSRDDLDFLGELMATGKITPVIDRVHPLSETAEAVRYLETGHARGKVVLRIA